MFCSNCGAKLDDDAVFCASCGVKCENDNSQSSSQGANYPNQSNNVSGANYPNQSSNVSGANYPTGSNYPGSNMQGSNYGANEQSVSVAEDSYDSNSPEFIPVKKKKKFLKVLIPIVAVVAVITAFALIFGRTIHYTVSPETYVAGLIKTTADDIEKDWTQVEKNVFGFDVSMNEEMTGGIKADITSGNEDVSIDLNVANDPKKEKLLFEGKVNADGSDVKAYGYLDNENMGIMLPGSDNKYLSLPSKDIGKELAKSKNYLGKSFNQNLENDEDVYDMFRSLDLSYGTIKQTISPDKKASKKATNHIADNLIDFLEKADIGERESVKYEFEDEGKTVNAHEITLEFEVEDAIDLCIDTIEDINNDDKINKLAETDAIVDAFKEAKKELEKSDVDISAIEVKLIEHGGKIVSAEISFEVANEYIAHEITLTISATNRKSLLNGIKLTVSTDNSYEYEDGSRNSSSNTTEILLTSNWATKIKKSDDDIITVNLDVSRKSKSGDGEFYSSGGEVEFEMDFEKGKWKIEINSDDSGVGLSYRGKCSKEDGFSFSINEDSNDTYIDIDLTLKNEIDVKEKSGKNNNILKWSEDDFEDFVDAFEENIR